MSSNGTQKDDAELGMLTDVIVAGRAGLLFWVLILYVTCISVFRIYFGFDSNTEIGLVLGFVCIFFGFGLVSFGANGVASRMLEACGVEDEERSMLLRNDKNGYSEREKEGKVVMKNSNNININNNDIDDSHSPRIFAVTAHNNLTNHDDPDDRSCFLSSQPPSLSISHLDGDCDSPFSTHKQRHASEDIFELTPLTHLTQHLKPQNIEGINNLPPLTHPKRNYSSDNLGFSLSTHDKCNNSNNPNSSNNPKRYYSENIKSFSLSTKEEYRHRSNDVIDLPFSTHQKRNKSEADLHGSSLSTREKRLHSLSRAHTYINITNQRGRIQTISRTGSLLSGMLQ